MSKTWPTVRLGEVLTPTARAEGVDASKEYRLLGIRLEGQGPFLRETLMGTQTSATKLFRVATGDFIYSRLFACRGAFGVISKELDGCFVSGEFPTFVPVSGKVDVEFLKYWFRLPNVIAMVDADCSGSTPLTRNRFKENFFLALEIPLPALAEQRRVVARIEELAAQIHEARTLRHQGTEEAEKMPVAMAHRADLNKAAKERAGWKRKRLSDVIQFVDDSHKVQPDQSYPNLGIYSFGRGLFHKPPIDGLATSATALRRVKAGQFIYSRLFAFEGAYGRVTPEFDGAFVSQEYPTFDCDAKHVRSEFLAAYFKPKHLWKAIAAGSKGLGDRRQRVQPAQVLSHEIWLPPIAWQNRLAEVQAEVDALKRLQAETAAEMDALLPAILDRAFKGEL
jgi:type I restriction enzyme, S subunit